MFIAHNSFTQIVSYSTAGFLLGIVLGVLIGYLLWYNKGQT